MQKKVENILITGASSGIGEALAVYYAKHGAENLFLSGRNKERLDAVQQRCQEHGVKVYTKIIDVTEKENMQKWLEQCEQIAPLNLVVANAGVSTGEETSVNIFNTFNTNVMGVINTICPTVELYRKRHDKNKIIAITSSIAGYHGLPSCPSYSATKACTNDGAILV